MYAIPLTSKNHTMAVDDVNAPPEALAALSTEVTPDISAMSQEENRGTTSTIDNITMHMVPQTQKIKIWRK